MVRQLQSNRAGGHTHLWEERLQACLREAYLAKDYASRPHPTLWMKLIDLTQFMWYNRSIPTEIRWTVLVLIPKGSADNRELGLLGFVWKVVGAVIDTRIKIAV